MVAKIYKYSLILENVIQEHLLAMITARRNLTEEDKNRLTPVPSGPFCSTQGKGIVNVDVKSS